MTVTLLRILWLLASAAAYLTLGYAVPREEFGWLIRLLLVLFSGYGWFIWKRNRAEETDSFLFGAAILFRFLLVIAIPRLSDDVYRFVWDGRLLAHGFNPYLYLPSQLIHTPTAAQAGLDDTLFRQLNSPDYFTVYPPLNQAMFGLAAWLSNGSLFWNVIWLRLPIVLSEIGTMWLLTKLLCRLNRNPNLALLYGLNPLVILELTGNLHFEAVMIFLSLLAAWWLLQKRIALSAVTLALAIATKLLPLILLPLAIRRLGWKTGLTYAALTGGLTAALFLPFASLELVQNVFSSLDLYFQKFEFNASVYYVLRTIGYWIKGYNTIERVGVWLSITTTLSILWISFRWRTISIPMQVLAILTLYFALATTVHPWYVTTLVGVSIFTRFRYPLVWSALIPLSYFTYQTPAYQENLWLTAVEYSLVAVVMLLELHPFLLARKLAKPLR
ncbi:polyprenol phosphomannose-dependent alpha 1,6 mannosyltransferase MptB [Spirosoma taeanense]|uniref:Polyprenol phosphomannose-dependent alpha 1,6 mannosyltransferase MptB n=1 Tax=Spirosoma taeanense TaxID=2735870 RepID=A0A6M5Y2Z6_9BACT|nr:polyprenol phosphomannose-dependent alpha 1,6 mannosyltransferase MptB [Spirosoma taeanense]QJW88085.1 polyprenol phosphomannose-dependent alpha 1,6 mannosyltransferase MptB [Spirosoma taeanense]